jgi:glycosyltransferase involved in cell wall biosynthesis
MIEKTEKEIMKNWKAYEKPLVSICCLTYNHENFIAMSLDSMLTQETDFPFEIIIRDDCSTDNTTKIVREYAEKFPHIISTILETENQFSKGVNPFIPTYDKSVGKYIAILEGDDYWRDDSKLQKQVAFLDNNKDYILSYNNSIVIDENNQLVKKIRNPSPKDYTSDQMLCAEAYIPTNTVLFRKVISLSQEQFRNTLNGDTVLWHLLGRYGKSKYQNDIIHAAYRVHSGGIWSSLDNVEQFKNGIITKRVLKKISPNDFKLKARIDKSMNKMVAIWLHKAISSFDFKLLQIIVKQIMHNKELSIFRIVIRLPKVWLQHFRAIC